MTPNPKIVEILEQLTNTYPIKATEIGWEKIGEQQQAAAQAIQEYYLSLVPTEKWQHSWVCPVREHSGQVSKRCVCGATAHNECLDQITAAIKGGSDGNPL